MTAPVLDAPAADDPYAEVWALIVRAQAGDMAAFGLIYERYVDTVFRFIYFRVGNRPLAEDLCSDTFLRALKRISSFTWQGRDIGAWLTTIARNLVADHFKSSRYRTTTPVAQIFDEDLRGHSASPEDEVLAYLARKDVLVYLLELGDEQRQVIVLRFLNGLNVAETATAMGKNEGAIKALQHRAVRSLARLMAADHFTPREG